MRKLFILIAVWVAVCACGRAEGQVAKHTFMPENSLWVDDRHDFVNDYIQQQMFDKIINLGKALYDPYAAKRGEILIINHDWNNPDVNANAWRDGRGNTEVNMYGGMARHGFVNSIGFALVLCHELNHLYGPTPYVEPSLRISCEGVSDWGSSGWCLRNITEKLAEEPFQITPYMTKVCNQDRICMRRLEGAQGLGKLLASLTGERAPQYETPDPTVVWKTNLSYPSIQCRLDSYRSGILWQQRPLCWFKP